MPLLAEGEQLAWSQVPHNLLHAADPPVHRWKYSPGSGITSLTLCEVNV